MIYCEDHSNCLVVYEGCNCPMCELQEDLDEAEDRINDLESDVKDLESERDQLQDELDDARSG